MENPCDEDVPVDGVAEFGIDYEDPSKACLKLKDAGQGGRLLDKNGTVAALSWVSAEDARDKELEDLAAEEEKKEIMAERRKKLQEARAAWREHQAQRAARRVQHERQRDGRATTPWRRR